MEGNTFDLFFTFGTVSCASLQGAGEPNGPDHGGAAAAPMRLRRRRGRAVPGASVQKSVGFGPRKARRALRRPGRLKIEGGSWVKECDKKTCVHPPPSFRVPFEMMS